MHGLSGLGGVCLFLWEFRRVLEAVGGLLGLSWFMFSIGFGLEAWARRLLRMTCSSQPSPLFSTNRAALVRSGIEPLFI